ncbi:MAG: fibronectin type III domain-containing protein, partial [Lachnospiraceae bacterium]|nr:fibronectin type III domain-containing protein [Lachnospiraceae bacterium]
IQCNTNKKFKSGNKTVTVKKAKTTSAKISKLKSGKKYYVRMRAYKTIEGKKYAGSWSKVLTVKVK